MQMIERLKPWLGRKSVRGALVIAIILILVIVFTSGNDTDTTLTESQMPVVTLTTPIEYAGGQSVSLIGNVRAFTEANVTSDRAGRVVTVPVKLGQFVQAGQVIATLENASEQAAVLQAEGSYEAAIAAAAQSDVGVDEAQNSLKSAQNAAVATFQSAYNTTNGVIRNTIDTFFSDPDGRTPGLRIDGRGQTTNLNNERVAFQTILPTWQEKVNTISTASDLEAELAYAKQVVQRVVSLTDTFITIFGQQDNSSRYTEAELQGLISTFTGLRSTLIGVQSDIDGALSGLSSAEDAVQRAELGSSGGTTSAADAQVKQALGSLRAAQANLAKTVLRTPVSGTVNSLSVRPGDFVGSFTQVAKVANNNAFEIVTYISDSERDLISIGDTVIIEGQHEGRITEIAPAVDSATRKIEVRIAAEDADIVNGDTVRITKELAETETASETVRVPLSAVKFEAADGFVFTVEDGQLVEQSVTLGVVRGGSVEILAGLTNNDTFVVDARGLHAGEEVTVKE